jgi:hypothetical protein
MYTYAFFQGDAALELPTGIEGHLDLIVGAEQLTAVVEPGLEIESIQTNDERLMRAVVAHDQIVRTMFNHVKALLPLRFGTCFISGTGLQEHLASNAIAYKAKLEELTGKAEYTIKLVPHELPAPSSMSNTRGRDYFLAKRQQYDDLTHQNQLRQQELSWLLKQVSSHGTPMVRNQSADNVERLYILGDRQDESQLLEQVQQWQSACSTWHISVGEALPPYHFV